MADDLASILAQYYADQPRSMPELADKYGYDQNALAQLLRGSSPPTPGFPKARLNALLPDAPAWLGGIQHIYQNALSNPDLQPAWLAASFLGPTKGPPLASSTWYRGTPHTDRLMNWADVTPDGLKGVFFTSDPDYAAAYGPVRKYNVSGSIKRIELPELGDVGPEAWDRVHDAEVTRAHAEGHAGAHLFEPDGEGGWEEREMILFDPRNATEVK